MKNVLAVCSLFCFLLLFYGIWLAPTPAWFSGDWIDHYGKTIGTDAGAWAQEYSPLFHWLAFPFAFKQRTFYIATCLLIGLAIPLLLFKISKVPEVVLFYFSTTTIYYVLEFGGYLPLMLGFVFFLCFVWKKKLKFRIPLLLLSLLAHAFAFWLLIIYWMVELLFKANWKNIFPVSALTGCGKAPAIFEEPIAKSLPKPYNFIGEIRLGLIVGYLIRGFPFPLFIVAVYRLWKEKKHHFNAMIAICLFGGFLNDRVLLVASMFLVIGLARYYKAASRKIKVLIFVGALFLFVYNFYIWHLFKLEMAVPLC